MIQLLFLWCAGVLGIKLYEFNNIAGLVYALIILGFIIYADSEE